MGREAPGIDLRVVGYEKDDAGAMIDRGLADLAVGVFSDPPEGAVVRPLFEETFVGLARVGHPALSGPLGPEGYARLDHALFTVRRDTVGAIDTALAALGLKRRNALTLPHVLALAPVLAATNLVAAMPSRLAVRLEDARLGTFPIPLPLTPWRVDMIWNPLARSDKANAWLRAKVEQIGGALTQVEASSEGLVPAGDQDRTEWPRAS